MLAIMMTRLIRRVRVHIERERDLEVLTRR